ncbi:unnamed protein product [Moneuplotes crassus]|uniref:Uncharacterized protein n=1 Tax=Euplotes crassus TaxID=5936 RepID=A0AAD1ULW6_EUPCR|nr:unnamed protein product [Moneuplotes crassus]
MESQEPTVMQSKSIALKYPMSKELTEVRKTEEQIEQQSREINAQLFENAYFEKFEDMFISGEQSEIALFLDDYCNSKLTQTISKIKISVISHIHLFRTNFGNKHFRNFVNKSTPTAAENFNILNMERMKNLKYLNSSSVLVQSRQIICHKWFQKYQHKADEETVCIIQA